MSKKEIYLDKEGHQKFLDDIKALEEKLTGFSPEEVEQIKEAQRDGSNDNFAYEEAKRNQFILQTALRDKLAQLPFIKIVDEVLYEDMIGINDYVKVELAFSGEKPEEQIFKLVASACPDFDAEVCEISINSPLGSFLYKKKVGDQGSYCVDKNKVNVNILDKVACIGLKEDNSKAVVKRK